jgi:hypothetical protein
MSNEEATTPKRPTHEISVVVGEGEKKRWTKVGVAFTNKDGKGFNLFIDAVPLTGRLVARQIEYKTSTTEEDGGQQ